MYKPRHGPSAERLQSTTMRSYPAPLEPLPPIVATSTAGLPVQEQFDAWREQCGSVIDMAVVGEAGSAYPASCTTWKLGSFALRAVTTPATSYQRSKLQARRDAVDHWVFSVALRGKHRMRSESREFTALTGTPCIFTFADAFEGERTEIDWLCLFVPRDSFPELGPAIDRSCGRPLGDAMSFLLRDYLISLAVQLRAITEAELPRLVSATRAVIAASIAPSARSMGEAEVHLQQARLARVRHVVRQNLRSPTLTPKRMSKLVGMSRSQLYRLLEPSGGVANYIQQARLREASRALSDPDDHRDTHDIAEDLSFFDASSFSRVFRREYGCTPSDVRMSALSGTKTSPVRVATASAAPVHSLTSLLRTL
jgi:AraC-like DNA-binding protein